MKVGPPIAVMLAISLIAGLHMPAEYGAVGAAKAAVAVEEARSPSVPRLGGTSRLLPGDLLRMQLAGSESTGSGSGSRSSGGSNSNGGSSGGAGDSDELNGDSQIDEQLPADEDECLFPGAGCEDPA